MHAQTCSTLAIGVETGGISGPWWGFAVLVRGTFAIAVGTLSVQLITVLVRSVES